MCVALLYLLAFIALFALETGYLYLVRKYNRITDCHRLTSGKQATIAGAGIIFYIAVVIWYVASWLIDKQQTSTTYFIVGLTLVTACSFADDIKAMSVWPRLAIHFAAVAFLGMQFDTFAYPALIWTLFLVVTTGFINAYNFMDGINGMTAAYSISVLGVFLYLDIFQTPFIQPSLIVMTLISLVVFAFFNFRKRALVFSGDAGSIAMGYIVAAVLIQYMTATRQLTPLIFVSVYVTDTLLTLLRRIVEGENIFMPHTKHIYQQLNSVWGCGRLSTATGYALLQLGISIGYLQMQNIEQQVIYSLSATAFLVAAYLVLMVSLAKKRRNIIP